MTALFSRLEKKTSLTLPARISERKRLEMRKLIVKLNPVGYRLYPWDGAEIGRQARRGGYVRLHAVLKGGGPEPLIARLFAPDRTTGDQLYYEINRWLASYPDWLGIEAADHGEDVPVTLEQFQDPAALEKGQS